METNHQYHLSIPLNVDSLDDIPEGVLWEDVKFEEYQISKADYDNLFDLFCQYDKPFNTIIAEYEEDEIAADKIQPAIEMTEAYAAEASPEIKASTEKLLVVLRRAKELGKQILLSF